MPNMDLFVRIRVCVFEQDVFAFSDFGRAECLALVFYVVNQARRRANGASAGCRGMGLPRSRNSMLTSGVFIELQLDGKVFRDFRRDFFQATWTT